MTNFTEPIESLISWSLYPDFNTFKFPDFMKEYPDWPFNFQYSILKDYVYPISLNGWVAVCLAIIYFVSVHHFNGVIQNRQIKDFKLKNPNTELPTNLKKLPAVPYKITTTPIFKKLVLIHNIFLCLYSVWTFVGMTSTIHRISHELTPKIFDSLTSSPIKNSDLFWQCVCDFDNGMWHNRSNMNVKGLTFYAYLFYLSKYYEILDTVIILLKGRPSSLLQSYHHSGAILCMWSGTRYRSPPIWIFVVFNSFIHSIMYGYFTLSCLKIKVPKLFKQVLTSLQITQFVLGGSLAVVHLFVKYYDIVKGSFHSCVSTSEEAMAIYINVIYLTPLTMLFAAFYVDSYKKNKLAHKKKEKAN